MERNDRDFRALYPRWLSGTPISVDRFVGVQRFWVSHLFLFLYHTIGCWLGKKAGLCRVQLDSPCKDPETLGDLWGQRISRGVGKRLYRSPSHMPEMDD
jgi:hypothetical protein